VASVTFLVIIPKIVMINLSTFLSLRSSAWRKTRSGVRRAASDELYELPPACVPPALEEGS